jgi:hypothetical protein
MRKILLLILFLPSFIFAIQIEKKSPAAEIYDFLKISLPPKSTITFFDINLNNEDLIEELQKLILTENYLSILDNHNLSELAKQSMLQDEPHFKKSETHKFIPSEWAIFIQGKTRKTNYFLKKILNYDYLIKIDSIQNGTTIKIFHLRKKYVEKGSIIYLIITLLISLFLLIYIQFLTKGYHGIFLINIWIIVNCLILFIYFFI